MRVIGGIARGRRILAPRGMQTRPTSDFLREVLFDLLSQQVPGRTFLDLYAGTGAVGIEALSRGAVNVVFVEHGPPALTLLRRNLRAAGFSEQGTVVPMEVLQFLRRRSRASPPFDVIFLDPPYRYDEVRVALGLVASKRILAPGGTLVLEQSTTSDTVPAPDRLRYTREVRHGSSVLHLYRGEAA